MHFVYILYSFCIHQLFTSCTTSVYKIYTQFPSEKDLGVNFLRIKAEINKSNPHLINYERSETVKTKIPTSWLAMWLSDFVFEHQLNSISTVFEATCQYFSIIVFLQNLCHFPVFVFGHRAQNKHMKIKENFSVIFENST